MIALRAAARVAVVVGAIGAVALMLYVGRRNQHYWLLVLFAGWDAAPFVALGLADLYAARWTAATRITLAVVTILTAVLSLGFYVDVIVRPRPQPAALFLIIPAVSWLFFSVVPIAERLTRQPSAGR